MPDYRKIAAAKARKYGYDPGLFTKQIGAESGFNPEARSGAGAVGIAQIVPRYHPGVDPTNPVAALDYAAKYMAGLYHKYGNYKDALSVYNSGRPWAEGKGISETRNYVSKIMSGPRPSLPAAQGGGVPRVNLPGARGAAAPSVPMPDFGMGALRTIALGGSSLGALRSLLAAPAHWAATHPSGPETGGPQGGKQGGKTGGAGFLGQAGVLPSKGRGKVSVAGGANRPGHGIVPVVFNFLSTMGVPIRIGTGTNHSRMTVNGNVSDHWDGHASDIPASGQHLTNLGRRALIAAGMPRAQAMKTNGGLFNLDWNGHRIQVIFNTREGGNHWNHLHVGVR